MRYFFIICGGSYSLDKISYDSNYRNYFKAYLNQSFSYTGFRITKKLKT